MDQKPYNRSLRGTKKILELVGQGPEQITPHNMTAKEARRMARGLSKETAEEMEASSSGRRENEHMDNFALRMKLKKAIYQLKKGGFVYKSETAKPDLDLPEKEAL